jgi:hypothetical protein
MRKQALNLAPPTQLSKLKLELLDHKGEVGRIVNEKVGRSGQRR